MKEELSSGSRNQRRLRKKLVKAAETRERKLDDGKLSLESGLGKLVIVVSSRKNYKRLLTDPNVNPDDLGKETKFYHEEAERLRAERAKDHQAVVIRSKAVPTEMKLDFADPEVTDIVLIGHGSIGALWADSRGYFTWQDAAKSAAYLKRGRVEQRMCGDFSSPVRYHVPLGTFAVSKLSNVTAAVGMVIPDRDPSDDLFHPIYSDETDVLSQMDSLNEQYIDNTTVVT